MFYDKETYKEEHTTEIESDVVIIGAGLFGGLMATKLAEADISVAMIDSGPVVDRTDSIIRFKESPRKDGNSPYKKEKYAPIPPEPDPFEYYVQPKKDIKDPLKQVEFGALYLRNVGGTSWHFTGHAERMYPEDFELKTAYGRGENWPISYNLLEPYYRQVEEEWGVSGNDEVVAPTKHPYPLPYTPLTYLDQQVNVAAEKLGDSIGPMPHCRNSVPYDGRPQCCGNASCRFICPVGAKYDGSVNVFKAVGKGAKLFSNHVVYHIEVGDDQQIDHIKFKNFTDPDNPVEGVARAKIFILAAHGIESPRLLLMSKNKNAPNGVANSSDQVGRNLMSMVGINMWGYSPEPVYPFRGPVNATGAFWQLRNGEFRKDFASIATIIINGGFDPTNAPLDEADMAVDKDELFGPELRERVYTNTAAQVYFDNSVEVLPDPENRITLDYDKLDYNGMPRPKIEYKIDEYTVEGVYVSWKRGWDVLRAMGCTSDKPGGKPLQKPTRKVFDEYVKKNGIKSGAAMIAGTTRMGIDPGSSVVDTYCRSHDHDNLFIVGTGTYVTSGSVSPSLTAAAISIRSAEHIVYTLKGNEG
ncbi:GMC family oxidoreductase [Terasakiella sp. A23]|uniref:GMC family oxidoreductase n=1 Tax=Terasakiella sp. FCG-A23 TaxID=3080561 RepID=UPI0029557F73|nr:GMC family oxidoreductase [Terasakiella sp. A23]MDV7340640.1 GMC family oxidoreductase [Terasakiella sp. A23]